jgi:putative FmdB family regulatory protein
MPIYDFQCTNPYCRDEFEQLISPSERVTLCPACGSKSERVMSASSFKVKGKYTAKTGYSYHAQNKPLGSV